jgi:hypothetical protein
MFDWVIHHAAYPFSFQLGALLFWGPIVLAWWLVERYLFHHYLNKLNRTGRSSWYTRSLGYSVPREDRFKSFWAERGFYYPEKKETGASEETPVLPPKRA